MSTGSAVVTSSTPYERALFQFVGNRRSKCYDFRQNHWSRILNRITAFRVLHRRRLTVSASRRETAAGGPHQGANSIGDFSDRREVTFLVLGDDPLVGFEFGDWLGDANQSRIAVTDEARKRPGPPEPLQPDAL
jgi:hypothetical protein